MLKRCLSLAMWAIALQLSAQSIEALKVTHGPWLQNLTPDGVTVCWTTNFPSVPGILLARSGQANDSLVRNSTDGLVNTGGTLHRVRLTGLVPGQPVTCRILSVELLKHRPYQVYYGDTLKGKPFTFTAPDPVKKQARFLVVNDIHTNGGKLAGMLQAGHAAEQDVVILNGDILDVFETEGQLLGPIIDTCVKYFASQVPFVFNRGNHETRGIMARHLMDYLDFPEGRYYHAFDRGPVHFVMLDCGEDKPDSNRYYYGLADFDRYRFGELDWLRRHVKSSEYRDAPFRVIVVHMPLLAGDAFGYGPTFLTEHFGPVLREAGADILIAAHTHRHAWMDRDSTGLGFPMLINNTVNRIEAESDGKTLSLKVMGDKDELVLSKELKRRN